MDSVVSEIDAPELAVEIISGVVDVATRGCSPSKCHGGRHRLLLLLAPPGFSSVRVCGEIGSAVCEMIIIIRRHCLISTNPPDYCSSRQIDP